MLPVEKAEVEEAEEEADVGQEEKVLRDVLSEVETVLFPERLDLVDIAGVDMASGTITVESGDRVAKALFLALDPAKLLPRSPLLLRTFSFSQAVARVYLFLSKVVGLRLGLVAANASVCRVSVIAGGGFLCDDASSERRKVIDFLRDLRSEPRIFGLGESSV